MKREHIKIFTLLCLVLGLCLSGRFAGKCLADEGYLWQAMKSENTFALLRHTLAPGTGDPANFSVRDCTTQRLLSQKGRDQAKSIGNRFRENGIQTAAVYSSQWCRCLETAELLDLGPVQELKILNSFFSRFENRDKQTSALKSWLAQTNLNRPLILVTHQDTLPRLPASIPVLARWSL